MAEIIDLDEQKRREQARRAAEEKSRRMKMALQMFQCSRCAMKCMKCGSQLNVPSSPQQAPAALYRFCQSCREEYEEFLERLHGRGDPRLYWCNHEWMEVWKAWMHYQDALSRYELSEGFRQLLRELNER
ncbi:MAG: hypothetical protein ACUVXD_05435 [Thermodesulfobacteriota bacterium]